jgi:hypothetical protein
MPTITLTLQNQEVRARQCTKWRAVTDGAQICIVEIMQGDLKGKNIVARQNKNGTLTSLKDASESFMQEWYNKSIKLHKLNFKIMSTKTEKTETKKAATKTTKTTEKTATKKAATKTTSKKAPVKKAPEKKAAPKKAKKVGVIASILEFIEKAPAKGINNEQILAKLVKRFPDKAEDSMRNTIRAQVMGGKRPVRMEKEKNVTFNIVVDDKKKTKTFSIKK